MRCRDFVRLIGRRLDGDLNAGQAARFDQHGLWCEQCSSYFEGYKKTIKASKLAFGASTEDNREDSSEEIPERLVNRILDAHHRTRSTSG